jgi:hypothetical protein
MPERCPIPRPSSRVIGAKLHDHDANVAQNRENVIPVWHIPVSFNPCFLGLASGDTQVDDVVPMPQKTVKVKLSWEIVGPPGVLPNPQTNPSSVRVTDASDGRLDLFLVQLCWQLFGAACPVALPITTVRIVQPSFDIRFIPRAI